MTTSARYSGGVLQQIGTTATGWRNPHLLQLVNVTASSYGQGFMELVVGFGNIMFGTQNKPHSWVCLDLLDHEARPSAYSLERYRLRCWALEASTDGLKWIGLRKHDRRATFSGNAERGLFEIRDCPGYFRYFRLVSLDLDPESDTCGVLVSGFELYGPHRQAVTSPAAPAASHPAPEAPPPILPPRTPALPPGLPLQPPRPAESMTAVVAPSPCALAATRAAPGGSTSSAATSRPLARRPDPQAVMNGRRTNDPYALPAVRQMTDEPDRRTTPYRPTVPGEGLRPYPSPGPPNARLPERVPVRPRPTLPSAPPPGLSPPTPGPGPGPARLAPFASTTGSAGVFDIPDPLPSRCIIIDDRLRAVVQETSSSSSSSSSATQSPARAMPAEPVPAAPPPLPRPPPPPYRRPRPPSPTSTVSSDTPPQAPQLALPPQPLSLTHPPPRRAADRAALQPPRPARRPGPPLARTNVAPRQSRPPPPPPSAAAGIDPPWPIAPPAPAAAPAGLLPLRGDPAARRHRHRKRRRQDEGRWVAPELEPEEAATEFPASPITPPPRPAKLPHPAPPPPLPPPSRSPSQASSIPDPVLTDTAAEEGEEDDELDLGARAIDVFGPEMLGDFGAVAASAGGGRPFAPRPAAFLRLLTCATDYSVRAFLVAVEAHFCRPVQGSTVENTLVTLAEMMKRDRPYHATSLLIEVLKAVQTECAHTSPAEDRQRLLETFLECIIVTDALIWDSRLLLLTEFGAWLTKFFPDRQSHLPGQLNRAVREFVYRVEDRMQDMRSRSKQRATVECVDGIKAAQQYIFDMLLACGRPTDYLPPDPDYSDADVYAKSMAYVCTRWIQRNTVLERSAELRGIRDLLRPADGEPGVAKIAMSLACPISLRRIQEPGKGLYCRHIQCFDLRSFLRLNMAGGHVSNSNWRCPICNRHVSQIDLYYSGWFAEILAQTAPDVDQVEVLPDGRWALRQRLPKAAEILVDD